MRQKKQETGFTLIEVLMAMAILAMAGMAMLRLSGDNIRNSAIIEEKMLAGWVAENELTAIRLSKKWPKTNWRKEERELAGRTWHVRFRSVKTTQDDFRAVEVEVRDSRDTKKPALAVLQTYMVEG